LRRFTFTVRPRVLSSRGALRPFFFLFLGLRAMRVLLAQVSRTVAFMSLARVARAFPASASGVSGSAMG
jgi:hypothetical protein